MQRMFSKSLGRLYCISLHVLMFGACLNPVTVGKIIITIAPTVFGQDPMSMYII